jgi:hypothetical protein
MEHRARRTPNIVATGLIWGFSTAMLGICIPLVAITGSGIVLPLSVLLGATIATVVVWRSSARSASSPRLTGSVYELEQRVANLEAICSSNELNLRDSIKQLESRNQG